MAQAMASMGGSTRLTVSTTTRVQSSTRPSFAVRAQAADPETSRRGMISLMAVGLASGSFVQAVLAEPSTIRVGGPPAPSGGLPGTLNSDEARDLDLPLKERFYLQPLTPEQAAARAKVSAKEIVSVKDFIDKKAWPYVQNDLRLRASYLRYDLKTVISAKPKPEKQALSDLTGKLFQSINSLDYAAKIKSSDQAQKYYAETVSNLNDVLAKLG
ncbi:Oxygen-evolving enhancer protein 3-2, chloroplastic [Linum perenne]